jgi:hypothetical protein
MLGIGSVTRHDNHWPADGWLYNSAVTAECEGYERGRRKF